MIKQSKEFKEWANDLSRAKEAENIKFIGNTALIEVYRRAPKDNKEATVDLIVEDTRDKSGYKRRKNKTEAFIEPIGKVLAVGNEIDKKYKGLKVGGIVTLPDDIKNTVDNPEFLLILQTSKGNSEPKIPAGMQRKVAVFNRDWEKYRYRINKLADLTSIDTVTFLVPLHELTIPSIESI